MKFFYTIIIIKNIIFQYLFLLKNIFFDRLINISLWALISLFVTGYILPKMGLVENFGLIQFSGVLATVGLFEAYYSIFPFMVDIEGSEIIYHELSTPINSIFIFLSRCISNGIFFIILTLFMIPIGKLLLWNIIFLKNFNWGYLITIIIVANIFYSSFVLLIVSLVKNMHVVSNVWSRCIFPLWFLGGFQFSWEYLYETNKFLAYIDLLNPIIYINEGFKIAILNKNGLCLFSNCIIIILLFSFFSFFIGYYKIRKKLDFI